MRNCYTFGEFNSDQNIFNYNRLSYLVCFIKDERWRFNNRDLKLLYQSD